MHTDKMKGDNSCLSWTSYGVGPDVKYAMCENPFSVTSLPINVDAVSCCRCLYQRGLLPAWCPKWTAEQTTMTAMMTTFCTTSSGWMNLPSTLCLTPLIQQPRCWASNDRSVTKIKTLLHVQLVRDQCSCVQATVWCLEPRLKQTQIVWSLVVRPISQFMI